MEDPRAVVAIVACYLIGVIAGAVLQEKAAKRRKRRDEMEQR